MNRGFELQEKKREMASQSLQARAMKIIEEFFPNEEDQDFLYSAMSLIEDNGITKMLLVLTPHRQRHWLESKISSQ